MNEIIHIKAQQSEVQAKRSGLANMISERVGTMANIEADIRATQGKLDSLKPMFEDALTRQAADEATVAEVTAIRQQIAAAEKEVSAARKHEGEANELRVTLPGLRKRLVAFDGQLAGLAIQRDEAITAAIWGEVETAKASYASAAENVASAWVEVMELNETLRATINKDPGITTRHTIGISLPGFSGQAEFILNQGNLPQFKETAKARIAGRLSAAGV